MLTSAGVVSEVRAWEVGTWSEILFEKPLLGMAPAYSPDGKLLVIETGVGVARLLDPGSGKEYARLEDPNQDRAGHFCFSPDGTKLVSATGDGDCLHIWDLQALTPAAQGNGPGLGLDLIHKSFPAAKKTWHTLTPLFA